MPFPLVKAAACNIKHAATGQSSRNVAITDIVANTACRRANELGNLAIRFASHVKTDNSVGTPFLQLRLQQQSATVSNTVIVDCDKSIVGACTRQCCKIEDSENTLPAGVIPQRSTDNG